MYYKNISLLIVFLSVILSSHAQKDLTIFKNGARVTYKKICENVMCALVKVDVVEKGNIKHSFTPNKNMVSIAIPDDQLIFIEDYNFDGYNDVRIYRQLAADGVNTVYDYWILDPKSEEYVYMPEYSDISFPEVHKTDKEIVSTWRRGCCMDGTDIYRIVNNKPVVQRRVVKTVEYGVPKLKIYNRINDELILEQ